MITYEQKRKVARELSRGKYYELSNEDEEIIQASLDDVLERMCENVDKLNNKQLMAFVDRLTARVATLHACDFVVNGGQRTAKILGIDERIEIAALIVLERAALLLPDLTLKFADLVSSELSKRGVKP